MLSKLIFWIYLNCLRRSKILLSRQKNFGKIALKAETAQAEINKSDICQILYNSVYARYIYCFSSVSSWFRSRQA